MRHFLIFAMMISLGTQGLLFSAPPSRYISKAWVGFSGSSNTLLDLQLERNFWGKSSALLRFRESRLNSAASQEVFVGIRRSSLTHRLGLFYGGGFTLLAIRETGKIGGPYLEYGATFKLSPRILGQLGYSIDYAKRDDIRSIRTFYSISLGYQF